MTDGMIFNIADRFGTTRLRPFPIKSTGACSYITPQGDKANFYLILHDNAPLNRFYSLQANTWFCYAEENAKSIMCMTRRV